MLPGLTRRPAGDEVMDGAQVEMIDAASMDILENVGVQFRDPIALEDWRKVGAKVVGEMVYLDRGLVRDLIATIPADFTYSRAEPRQQRAPRRAAFGLRADDRRALPARSRRRAPQPDARRSGDVPQAQPHGARDAFLGASYRRADGPPDQPPAPAHHLFLDETLRQDVHGHDHQPEERRRRDGDVRDPVRRGLHGGEPGHDRQLQRQLAAGLGRDDAGRDARLLPQATSRCCARPSCWAARTRRPPCPPRWRS
jgi:hypothetical protein